MEIDMKKLKILNLYCWIGWNRKLRGDDHVIIAVENDTEIAKIYKDLFPNDTVVVADAHQYLLEHYKEFDFIWSSPPYQSHSSFRQNICVRYRWTPAVYPDMKLYEEILFLQYNFKGKRIVENVKPYYEPLIKPWIVLQRHYFRWNVYVYKKEFEKDNIRTAQIPDLEKKYWYDLSWYKLKNKRQVLRNCVSPELWKYFLDNLTNDVNA
jgi:DNA (cytosine-5)-methyltransferase 1